MICTFNRLILIAMIILGMVHGKYLISTMGTLGHRMLIQQDYIDDLHEQIDQNEGQIDHLIDIIQAQDAYIRSRKHLNGGEA